MQIAKKIKNITHDLILDQMHELDHPIYFDCIQNFLCCFEGLELEAYLDGILDPHDVSRFITTSKFYAMQNAQQHRLRKQCAALNQRIITTVGIGANIESKDERNALDKELNKIGFMEKVYYGTANLSYAEAIKIFSYQINQRIIELKKIYYSEWQELKANERIAILSLYFNSPKLVNANTRFSSHIKQYIKTKKTMHLQSAVNEVLHHSNPHQHHGIQRRRDAEGELLASYLL